MKRYNVNITPCVKFDGRIRWYIHSSWRNKQEAEKVAAELRESFRNGGTRYRVKITEETISVWAMIRKAARRAFEWFVTKGANLIGEVLAAVSIMALLVLLPIIAG